MNEKTPLDDFFETFMHIYLREVENVPTGLSQATAGRIEASVRQIREHEEHSINRMGPITRQHVEINRDSKT